MAYTPENNPYIPGDPYSYDLKWVVSEIDKWKTSEDAVEAAAASAQAAGQSAEDAAASAEAATISAGNAAESEAAAKNYADNIADPVSGLVTTWLTANITNPSNPPIDTSLTVGGAAADAEITGKGINSKANKTIEVQSDNLFIFSPLYGNPFIKNGVTITRNEDGSITLNGTADSTFRRSLYELANDNTIHSYIWLPAGQYSFKLEKISGSASGNGAAIFSIRAGTETNTVLYGNHPTHSETFASDSMCYFQIGSGSSFTNYRLRITINQAASISEYKPKYTAYDFNAHKLINNIVTGLSTFAYPIVKGAAAFRCQGGCLNNNIYYWLLGYSDHTISMHSIDLNTGTHSGRIITPDDSVLGHAQDITYNPNEDSYYVSTLLNNGSIVKLDSNFDYDSTYYLTDDSSNIIIASGICYDKLNNQYIVEDNTNHNFYIYDNMWTWIKTLITQETTPIVCQGIDTDGYYIYKTRTTSGGATSPHIITIDMDGNLIEYYDIMQLYGEEIEGIAYDDTNKIFYINTNSKDIVQTNIYQILPNRMGYHTIHMISSLI